MKSGEHRSKIEAAIAYTVSVLSDNKTLRHEHSFRCYHVLAPILYPDERTLIEVKQSKLKSFSPTRIIATNQRLIIAKPSFWNLWTGRNIFSSTKYETVPYNHIISISLFTGLILSSINIRMDVSSNTEGDTVEGIRSDAAKTIFIFLQRLTEYIQEEEPHDHSERYAETNPIVNADPENKCLLNMEKSRRIIKYKKSRFVWLGIEPLEYVAEGLCIGKEEVLKISIDELERMSPEELGKLQNSIFVCYDGTMANHISNYLKKKYGVSSYVLNGGIEAQIKEAVN